jgi:glucosylceramidase
MLTIENEPNFEPKDYPGERVDPIERAEIIGRHVGPTFKSLGLRTQILEWDHNWDKPQMPLAVLSDPVARRFISGVAWHCYNGDVSAQDRVHDAYPDKDAWVTECSGGDWSSDYAEVLGWMTDQLIIGAANSWSRGTLLWNLALDPAHGPHLGGCTDCRGVVTIDPATGKIMRNVEYYVLGHASPFVFPGAYRVATVSRRDEVEAAAFVNPDGSRIAILHRGAGSGALTLALDGRHYSFAMPKGSVATLRWKARGRRQ